MAQGQVVIQKVPIWKFRANLSHYMGLIKKGIVLELGDIMVALHPKSSGKYKTSPLPPIQETDTLQTAVVRQVSVYKPQEESVIIPHPKEPIPENPGVEPLEKQAKPVHESLEMAHVSQPSVATETEVRDPEVKAHKERCQICKRPKAMWLAHEDDGDHPVCDPCVRKKAGKLYDLVCKSLTLQ